MTEFTQPELYEAVQRYERDREQLMAEAEAAVVNWRFADDQMCSPLPHYDAIEYRASGGHWYAAKRRWYERDPHTVCFEHGFDVDGRIRLIRRTQGWVATLFCYSADMVDRIRYYGQRWEPQLERYLLRDGRTQELYHYTLNPHQYHHEKFSYDGNRCIESVERGRYLDTRERGWVDSTIVTIRRYEHDSLGLVRAFEEMGSWGNKLVYVRPLSESRRLKREYRRPFVGYSFIPSAQGADPAAAVSADAYGLEMNIDDEWPIDTVVLVGAEHLRSIANGDLTKRGTVHVGAANGDFKSVRGSGGKWVLLDARSPDLSIVEAMRAGLNVVLLLDGPEQLSQAVAVVRKLPHKRIVFAVRLAHGTSPQTAQQAAQAVRTALGKFRLAKSRVVIVPPDDETSVDYAYVSQPDVDGAFLPAANFASAIEILAQLALHHSATGPPDAELAKGPLDWITYLFRAWAASGPRLW